MTDIAIENGPFIVDLPSYKMLMFHSFLYVYQRLFQECAKFQVYPSWEPQIGPNMLQVSGDAVPLNLCQYMAPTGYISACGVYYVAWLYMVTQSHSHSYFPL